MVVNAAALAEPGVVGSGVECGERNWLGNECECGTGRAASTSDELHDPCKRCAAVVPAIDAAAAAAAASDPVPCLVHQLLFLATLFSLGDKSARLKSHSVCVWLW